MFIFIARQRFHSRLHKLYVRRKIRLLSKLQLKNIKTNDKYSRSKGGVEVFLIFSVEVVATVTAYGPVFFLYDNHKI